ncbi:hypothetical protein [Streptomyces spongiicola]|uniref:hypothetical protein n=1 Tax=Streptomyces spongiicola TaxID=1690221 RepID=UPI0021CF6CE2|nr:hypothetical protein [Streptomyces spongiicola]
MRPVPVLGRRHLAVRLSEEGLFTMEEGEHLNYRRWTTRWKNWNCARRVLQAAGSEFAGREGRKPVGLPHAVTRAPRHYCAFALLALLAGGASVQQVRLVLGHASAVITLRISARPRPGGDDRTRSAVDAVFGGLRAGCGQPGGADRERADRAARVGIRPSWSPRRSGRSRR